MELPLTAIAFFDVDETLISVKSMFDFYDYFLTAAGHSPEDRQRLAADLRALFAAGLPRKEGNRLFYGRFAGHRADELARHGRDWFAERLAIGTLFHQDVLEALRRHRSAGTRTVLVSGSFAPALDPIAEHAGADVVLCTRLAVRDGRYTGEVLQTMIGDDKARAARELMAGHGVDPADCHAYGDHVSDLDLLRLVGHPVAVGSHPDVLAEATRYGWSRLTGAPSAG